MYNVLVVDDEVYTRNFLKTQIPLLDKRFVVTGEAGNGLEALSFLQEHKVDLVITDIKMPRMDGLELSNKIYEINKKQHIVILSGFEEFDFARKALSFGVKDYLLKPIIKSQVKEVLERIADLRDLEIQEGYQYQDLVSLNSETTDTVIRKFFQSIIMDAGVEIKSLYPILHRLKINLFDGIGNIAVLSLNQEDSLVKSVQYQDIELYKYILFDICKEQLESTSNAWAFVDIYQNTCIFFTSDDQIALNHQMKLFVTEIESKMQHTIGVTISHAHGSMVLDLLSLKSSYAEALKMLLKASFSSSAIHDNKIWFEGFSQFILQIKSIGQTKDRHKIIEQLTQWYRTHGNMEKSNVVRFMLYCLESLTEDVTENKIVDAYQFLAEQLKTLDESVEFDKLIQLQANMILSIYDNGSDSEILSLPISKDAILAQNIKEYISANYAEPLSLPMLADKFQLNPTYISHLFHKHIGEPYVKFLNRTRIEQASKLLANPSYKVYNVADEVGYISVKHFNYVFKQYFDMTPTEFQASLKRLV
ncbi:response regulator transcription factor [Paenibacillus sp. B-A-8]|uniref:response regulator transcription factor n=1 Tax=Paenibacillus sp. B-A-8 TaxID=3400419 RepID=UPI003B01C58B